MSRSSPATSSRQDIIVWITIPSVSRAVSALRENPDLKRAIRDPEHRYQWHGPTDSICGADAANSIVPNRAVDPCTGRQQSGERNVSTKEAS